MEIQTTRRPEEPGRNGLVEQAEIECHECGEMVYANIDLSLNGNHVILCVCGHEHCRVVRNGKITSTRWDQRNRSSSTFFVTATTMTTTWPTGVTNYISNTSTSIAPGGISWTTQTS